VLRAGPVGRDWFGEPVIDIDPFGRNTEAGQGFALRGEVMKISAAPIIADRELTRDRSVADSLPSPGIK